jgi:hypothetical protein
MRVSRQGSGFEIDDQQYVGELDGVIAVKFGKPLVNSGSLTKVPLHIVGYSTQSQIKGLGATSLDFDYSRPVRSSVDAIIQKRGFSIIPSAGVRGLRGGGHHGSSRGPCHQIIG